MPDLSPPCAHSTCGTPPIVQWSRRTGPDTVEAVFACAEHAIDLEAAARIHTEDCSAPHPEHLPACDCTPEPLPTAAPTPPPVTLPTGWTVPAAHALQET